MNQSKDTPPALAIFLLVVVLIVIVLSISLGIVTSFYALVALCFDIPFRIVHAVGVWLIVCFIELLYYVNRAFLNNKKSEE